MEVVETIALISINATLVVQLVSFLLFLLIIHRIMIRPLDRVMQERNFLLERLNEEIEDAGDEYDDLRKQIKHQEVMVRDEALKIMEELEEEGEKNAADLIAQTREEINAMKSQARLKAAAILDEASAKAKKEAVAVADKIIARLLEHNGES